MTQNTITLIVLAVLVVFPAGSVPEKKNGDLTLWGKGRNILGQLPSEEAACAAVSSSARNGSQKDILQFVSSLMKLVRKITGTSSCPASFRTARPKPIFRSCSSRSIVSSA